MLLSAAFSFTHGLDSKMLGLPEVHLKQQLVGGADAKFGLAGSRAGSPGVVVKSCVVLRSTSVKTTVCSWKWPDSDQVLL